MKPPTKNEAKTDRTNWLRATDNPACIAFAMFRPFRLPARGMDGWPEAHPSRVKVVALIGASRYVDAEMTVPAARDLYRELRAAGWTATETHPPAGA